ncbi:MAG TPA: DMT family transporter [Burkholderiales bacterium]|nr:DMT family transporter [Burkholderiales bacterium]
MTEQEHLPRRLWWTLVGLTLAWGFNWTAMKVSLAEVSPWAFRALCLGGGAAILFLLLRSLGTPLRVPRSEWRRLVLLSFLNITCWNLLVAYGVSMIPSGRAAIIAYTMPVLAIPLSVWLLRERMNGRKLTGIALGVAGLVLLLAEQVASMRAAPVGALLMLAAAATWAIGTVLQKKFPVSIPVTAYTAWIMLVGGVPIIVVAAWVDLGRHPPISTQAWLAIGYNVFVAFAWAHWAWIKIATSVSVTIFSLSMLMIPVVGVISGMIFLGERPSAPEVGAMVAILAALAAVAVPRRG